MQSLNRFYYRMEWTENKEIGKVNATRAISSVFKILTVVFAVVAGFSFMDIAMLAGFCIGAVVCLVVGVILDYVAGTLIYSYIYVLSDGVLELKKEYRNGRITTYLKSDCRDLTVKDVAEDAENAETFFSKSNDNGNINYCLIKNATNNSIKIAIDDYMLAILRRSCK